MDDRAYEFDYLHMLDALAVDDDGQAACRVALAIGKEHAIACLLVIARHLATDHAAVRGVPVATIFDERRAQTTAFHMQRLEDWLDTQTDD
jgi:hypothetical protein